MSYPQLTATAKANPWSRCCEEIPCQWRNLHDFTATVLYTWYICIHEIGRTPRPFMMNVCAWWSDGYFLECTNCTNWRWMICGLLDLLQNLQTGAKIIVMFRLCRARQAAWLQLSYHILRHLHICYTSTPSQVLVSLNWNLSIEYFLIIKTDQSECQKQVCPSALHHYYRYLNTLVYTNYLNYQPLNLFNFIIKHTACLCDENYPTLRILAHKA